MCLNVGIPSKIVAGARTTTRESTTARPLWECAPAPVDVLPALVVVVDMDCRLAETCCSMSCSWLVAVAVRVCVWVCDRVFV